MTACRFVVLVLLFVLPHLAMCQPSQNPIVIDVTGNWKEGREKAHPDRVRTREPQLKAGKTKTFWQEFDGIEGDWALEFDYFPALDVDPDHPGDALQNRFEGFDGISINGRKQIGRWVKLEEGHYRLTCEVKAPAGPVAVEFTWNYTRAPRTRLVLKSFKADARYKALKPTQGGEMLVAHGLPFLAAKVAYDRDTWIEPRGAWFGRSETLGAPCPAAGMALPYDGVAALDAGDAEVKTIHFLGMVHVLDWGNGSWYTPKGDHRSSHFVGDRAGAIVLNFADGTVEEIPLVFGWNVWYSRPWDMLWHFNQWGGRAYSYEPYLFGGDKAKLKSIPDTLALVDGIRPRGSTSSNSRFIFSVDLQGRKLRSVALKNDPDLNYGPLISAVTVETDTRTNRLQSLPLLSHEPGNAKITTLAIIRRKSYEPRVRKLMHLLYTFTDELPALSKPVVPEGYFGPRYSFGPQPDAIYTATLLYHNGPGVASFIADRGMGCSSPVFGGSLTGNYTENTGIWVSAVPPYESLSHWFDVYRNTDPGKLPGAGQAWARGIGEMLREAMAFGYDKFVSNHVDWLDSCLYGKVKPPHWSRVPGLPNFVAFPRKVGDVEEYGNRETDGHGICMWGRAMMWHWLGRPRDWNERHWKATVDSVEWIQWQLDTNPIFPGIQKDILFAESECGPYEFYAAYNCLHGIKLAIRMAEQLGKTDEVKRWKALYERLRRGILDNAVRPSDQGPVWYTYEHTDWQDHAHKLAHIQLATEGDTYTPLQDYARGDEIDRRYLEISRNSYRLLMKTKDYNCLRMYGYGQGMMTQAALLLDQMADAEKFVDLMVRHAYLPRLGGWGSPEGIVTHRSGKYYLPVNGYAGQDSHIADSTKALRLMLGLDDNDPSRLRLVPRFPSSWSDLAVDDFPVLTGTRRQKVGYSYRRLDDRQEFGLRLEHDAGPVSLRLGPLPRPVKSATLDGRPVVFRPEHSGDSDWVWVELPGGKTAQVVVRFEAR